VPVVEVERWRSESSVGVGSDRHCEERVSEAEADDLIREEARLCLRNDREEIVASERSVIADVVEIGVPVREVELETAGA
jgi:hypothetical protein